MQSALLLYMACSTCPVNSNSSSNSNCCYYCCYDDDDDEDRHSNDKTHPDRGLLLPPWGKLAPQRKKENTSQYPVRDRLTSGGECPELERPFNVEESGHPTTILCV